jgi:hypothetical protein
MIRILSWVWVMVSRVGPEGRSGKPPCFTLISLRMSCLLRV